jgi:hypothetical protein
MRLRDRQGRLISLERWAELVADPSYVAIAANTIGNVSVHTVWSGQEDALFTTHVVAHDVVKRESQAFCREVYTTEAAAVTGHASWVSLCRKGS